MRNVFFVSAFIVDANGNVSALSGYPKSFDSKNYDGDVDKARIRADGELSECWGSMCKQDTRQIQTVIEYDISGNMIDRKTRGTFPESN